MSFAEAVKSGLRKYAVFEGRARRSEFWYFTLFSALMMLVSIIFYSAGAVFNTIALFIVGMVLSLALLTPNLAVGMRRYHDVGLSGKQFVIIVVLCVGLYYVGLSLIYEGVMLPERNMRLSLDDPAYLDEDEANTISDRYCMVGALLWLLSLVVTIINIVFLCKDSERGTNKYGPSPKY